MIFEKDVEILSLPRDKLETEGRFYLETVKLPSKDAAFGIKSKTKVKIITVLPRDSRTPAKNAAFRVVEKL